MKSHFVDSSRADATTFSIDKISLFFWGVFFEKKNALAIFVANQSNRLCEVLYKILIDQCTIKGYFPNYGIYKMKVMQRMQSRYSEYVYIIIMRIFCITAMSFI